MSKKKEYTPLSEYEIYYVDIKTIMEEKGISQNILSKITDLSINTIRSYYHSNIKRIDLDVVSRIAKALKCDINDILKKK
jgi:DNA-binding Xre family transcriptional regulator